MQQEKGNKKMRVTMTIPNMNELREVYDEYKELVDEFKDRCLYGNGEDLQEAFNAGFYCAQLQIMDKVFEAHNLNKEDKIKNTEIDAILDIDGV